MARKPSDPPAGSDAATEEAAAAGPASLADSALDASVFSSATLDMAAIHTACIALSDAAQHVRRTAVLAEAATVAALTRSLTAAPDDKAWVLTLEAVQQSMQGATGVFTQMSQAAVDLVRNARSGGG